MVQALLGSIKNMLGMNATQTKEFKMEAVKNNRNVFSAIKDISKMFSSQSRTDAKQNESLNSIETNTMATSAKVDRTNALVQESISIQTQMLSELKGLTSLINRNVENQNIQNAQGVGGLGRTAINAALTALGLGTAVAGGAAGYLQNLTGINDSRISNSNLSSNETYSPGAAGQTNLASTNLSAEEKAILETISAGESSGAYNIVNYEAVNRGAPRYFEGYERHPFEGQTGYTAAGRYQILASNYEKYSGAAGVSDFSPESQDKVALTFAKDVYSRQSGGRNLLEDIKNPELHEYITQTLRPTWHGIKGGSYLSSAYNTLKEGDETGAYSTGKAQPQDSPMGGAGGNVYERQQELAGIRKLPLSDNLKRVLQQAAAAAGVDAVVYSGGQAPKGSGGPRTGSTRHDHGNAADLYLMRNGKKLSDTNPEDRAIMAKFVSAAVAAGATGVGAGHGYMGPSNIHVGFGKQATWGGAPWIKQAASGVYNNQDLQAQGGAGSYGGGDGSGSYGAMGDSFSAISSILGAFGMGSFMGGNIMSLLSGFFGLPMGQMFGSGATAAYGANDQTTAPGGNSNNFSSLETEENEPEDADRRMEEAPPHAAKAKQAATAVESDYRNYEGITNQIQMAALEEISKNPVVIEKSVQSEPYSTNGAQEAPTAFGAVSDSRRETRASWAPRIAVLRPGDEAKNLTWAARIAPNLA